MAAAEERIRQPHYQSREKHYQAQAGHLGQNIGFPKKQRAATSWSITPIRAKMDSLATQPRTSLSLLITVTKTKTAFSSLPAARSRLLAESLSAALPLVVPEEGGGIRLLRGPLAHSTQRYQFSSLTSLLYPR